jgi:two-component system CheB/CheR fusion protein
MEREQSSIIGSLKAARDEALEAAAAKDRFVAIAAHELRQPLAALILQADLLRRQGMQRQDEQLVELGEDILATVRREARLVGDLLDVSRARIGKLTLKIEQIDLGALVARVATSMAKAAPSVHLRLDIPPPETLRCRADAVRVEQIVSNLMENALKFAAARGAIDVRVAVDEGFARITVADNGRGMAPGARDSVFHLFGQEQGRPATPGMGIGLALVRELAAAHGGHVRAYSAGVGMGAEFSVWLPLSTAWSVQAYETTTCLDRSIRQSRGKQSCSISSCRPPSKATATTGISGASVI